MKIDNTIVILFIFPVIALCLALITPMVIKTDNIYSSEGQPEFLTTIDQLSLVTMAPAKKDSGLKGFKDKFRHDWKLKDEAGPGPGKDESVAVAKPNLSLVVNDGFHSFCIIDGQKMRVGQKTDRFSVKEITGNTVTVRWSDGSKETFNVKAY